MAAIENKPTLRVPGGRVLHKWPTPPTLDCFSEPTRDLCHEVVTLEAGRAGKRDELAALRQALADAEVADAEALGAAGRSGNPAPKPTAPAIAKKIEQAERDLAGVEAATAQAYEELGAAMALDAAEYAPKKITESLTSELVQAVAEIQRAIRAVERVQRERDAATYVAQIAQGIVPREKGRATPLTTTLRRPNGSPVPVLEALEAGCVATSLALSASEESAG
jgi:hypothetical protein